MLAESARDGPGSALGRGEWIFERKLDGLRGIAVRDGSGVGLWSRNQLPYTARFPGVVAALRALPVPEFVIDGEIVAFRDGQTSFEALQSGAEDPVYIAFDLISLLGRDTTGLPIDDRTALLHQALDGADGRIRPAEQMRGDWQELLLAACRSGWEGLVAKRAGAPYRSGRSPDWVKLKCTARQELVIGGWTEPSGARTGFGALLVGYYDGAALRYAGKVGTGFSDATLKVLFQSLHDLTTDGPPFADAPTVRGTHWVRPRLVAEIEFGEWTREGRLRHPRFVGLRPDKKPEEVRREDARPGPAGRNPSPPPPSPIPDPPGGDR